MKLTLDTKYKSLEPFEVELSDFTILTGLNGAGKSQILKATDERVIQVVSDNVEIESKKFVNNNSLSPDDPEPVHKQKLINDVGLHWNQYISHRNSLSMSKHFRQNPTVANFLQAIPDEQKNVYKKITEKSDRSVLQLKDSDFYDNDLLIDKIGVKDVFNQNFSILFKRYHDKFEDNRRKRYYHNEYGDNEVTFISDAEFLSKYGEPPWEFVNKIIKEAKLDYEVVPPKSSYDDGLYELKLINNFNEEEVKFSDLSSGEKVLMSLALALYNSKFDIEFPKLLLMDEPDASLHPSMSKQFLDVIQNVFVKEKGVKVIMTTHSPSTVALAPEEAIFIVNKAGERIEKASKDEALKILTTGVPSFSVNYENRRQVFVESSNDVYFYEKMYGKLSNYLEPEISLSFISSGESATDKNKQKIANCEQVVNITTILRESGNKFIFGIIDWDTNNLSSDYVKVLGEGKRYNIENYIFDPIFISALLFQEQEDGFTRENLKLEKNESYSDFRNLTSEQLQIISDFLTNKLAENIKSTNEERITIQYLNEKEIQIPMWYLHYNGHHLEECLKQTFPKLRKFNQEQALKKEVIDKYIDNIPEFISQDVLNVFKQIQTL